jgi:hypothetical protein
MVDGSLGTKSPVGIPPLATHVPGMVGEAPVRRAFVVARHAEGNAIGAGAPHPALLEMDTAAPAQVPPMGASHVQDVHARVSSAIA